MIDIDDKDLFSIKFDVCMEIHRYLMPIGVDSATLCANVLMTIDKRILELQSKSVTNANKD